MVTENRTPAIALTIAGFDPSSGAGITADLKTFHAHNLYAVCCITALTVQSTIGVRSAETVSASQVGDTLACLAEDISFEGIKIGMLGSGEIAAQVDAFLATQSALRRRVVLDPVVQSSSGTPLIDPDGIEVIRRRLLTRVGWITPNVDELVVLAGERPAGLEAKTDPKEIVRLARKLSQQALDSGNDDLNIVVTGGHLARPDDFVRTAAGEEFWLRGKWVETNATHGTGCAFSSALLANLIAGHGTGSAAMAKDYVTQALRSAFPLGRGKGPMNHLFSLNPAAEQSADHDGR